jgi:hypothetical protein
MSLAVLGNTPPAPAAVEVKSALPAPTATPASAPAAADTVSISPAGHQAAAGGDPDHDGH